MRATNQDDIGMNLLQPNYVFVYVTLQCEYTNAGHVQLPTTLSEANFQRLRFGAAHCFAEPG
jgi:hypothetical protein